MFFLLISPYFLNILNKKKLLTNKLFRHILPLNHLHENLRKDMNTMFNFNFAIVIINIINLIIDEAISVGKKRSVKFKEALA